MKPKVLIVTDRSDLAETQLIAGLSEHGLSITVMANDSGKHFGLLESPRHRLIPLRLKGRFDFAGGRVIRKELRSARYTVVYAFNPRAIACALRASRGMNLKVIGYRGVIGNAGFLNPESWVTFLHPRLARIICVSKAVQHYFESIGLWRFRLRRGTAVTIYKGHDLSWYDKPVADLAEFSLPDNAFVITCTGRDRPGKGFSTLIEAMNLIPDEYPLYLLLVGDLKNNVSLMNQVQASRNRDRIHFAGYRNDAPQVAGASSALVLPSESEGLPRVVIEAMAYRRPVIVTEAGGMPELVTDGEEGYVVPVRDPGRLAEALIKLVSDRANATAMGEHGRRRIERDFSIQGTVEQTLALINELTGELGE